MTVLSTMLAGLSFPTCLMNASGAGSGTQAVSGLSHGEDTQGALSRGAKSVHVGSALMKAGPAAFACLQQQLTAAPTTREVGA